MYPVTTFVHLDDKYDVSHDGLMQSSFQEPNANSTMITDFRCSDISVRPAASSNNTPRSVSINSAMRNTSSHPENSCNTEDDNVGHMSHIPRKPPTPTTYTIPSFSNKTIVTEHCCEEDLFGMIKLKDNDVCYTSGSIEWVGRKRSYPLNSGFKVINESSRQGNEPLLKRVKRLDKTFTVGIDKIKECDCADVLPTVNAIVDHLNALHEAVDLVDLRLNTLEDVVENS